MKDFKLSIKIFFIFTFLFLYNSGFCLSVYAHGMTHAQQLLAIHGGYLTYIRLGAEHMLTGYDHLLFLFGVMFFLTRFNQIVKFITAFTLGHSITLLGATFLGIRADYYLIDSIIALTVFYKGFENLDGFKRWFKWSTPSLIRMVFIFGLIHGFGLSTRLQNLPIWETKGRLVYKILSFNIGVEVGQITALVVMMLILAGWRHTRFFTRFASTANGLLAITGILLFLMQLHGYLHKHYANDFGLNTDQHFHIHERDASKTLLAPEP